MPAARRERELTNNLRAGSTRTVHLGGGLAVVTARTPAVPSGRLAEVAITCPYRQPSVASSAAAASTALRQQVSGAGRS